MKILFGACLMLAALSACGDRKVKDGVTEPFPPQFHAIRERILMPRCSKCHSLVESRKLLLEKWVNPGSAGDSGLYAETESGSMPPYGNKLLDEEIEAIRIWIDAGAPND